MKKTNFLFFAIALAALSFAGCGESTTTGNSGTENSDNSASAAGESTNMKIDMTSSMVQWKGVMMGMYDHSGIVALKDANVQMAGDQITGGTFVVDMTSINPTDENYNPEEGRSAEKLVGHLSSPDFFDVENHPTATFEIKQVNGSTATGTLTIRGVSNEETVRNIQISPEGSGYKITGNLTFDRKKYNVAFDHPMKEMVISNDIDMEISLVAMK